MIDIIILQEIKEMKMHAIMAFVMAALCNLAMAQTNTQTLALSNAYIGNWIQPNCLVAIVFMLMFFAFFGFGLTLLAQI